MDERLREDVALLRAVIDDAHRLYPGEERALVNVLSHLEQWDPLRYSTDHPVERGGGPSPAARERVERLNAAGFRRSRPWVDGDGCSGVRIAKLTPGDLREMARGESELDLIDRLEREAALIKDRFSHRAALIGWEGRLHALLGEAAAALQPAERGSQISEAEEDLVRDVLDRLDGAEYEAVHNALIAATALPVSAYEEGPPEPHHTTASERAGAGQEGAEIPESDRRVLEALLDSDRDQRSVLTQSERSALTRALRGGAGRESRDETSDGE